MIQKKFFRINYFDKKNKNIVIIASSKLDARQKFLRNNKVRISEIKEVSEPIIFKLRRYFPKKTKKIKGDEFIAIIDNLGTMLGAGISLNRAIQSVKENVKDKIIKSIMESIYLDIQKGNNLSESMEKFKDSFGNLTLTMIRLGEKTGNLPEALEHLSNSLRTIEENRTKLKSATRYPMFILVSMMIAFSVVITMVIPQFQSIFNSLGMTLPVSTRFLIFLEYVLSNFWWVILLGVFAVFSTITYLHKYNEEISIKIDKMQVNMPILGKILRMAMLSRFIHVFNKMNNVTSDLFETLNTSINIIENKFIKQELMKIVFNIKNGKTLKDSFNSSGLFDSTTMFMISAGDESGDIKAMFDKIEKYYQKNYNDSIDKISSSIEPLLIIALVSFVAVLALGIFLPMWNMADVL